MSPRSILLDIIGIGLITLASINLSSCGKPTGNKEIDRIITIGQFLQADREMNASEIELATKVCNAFQSKRLGNLPAGKIFVFDHVQTSCNNDALISTRVDTRFSNTNNFVIGANNVFYSANSDENTPFRLICAGLGGGTPRINQQGDAFNKIIQFSFTQPTNPALAQVVIYEGEEQANHQYLCFGRKELLVEVTNDVQLLGLERKISTYGSCNSNPQKQSVDVKEFIRIRDP